MDRSVPNLRITFINIINPNYYFIYFFVVVIVRSVPNPWIKLNQITWIIGLNYHFIHFFNIAYPVIRYEERFEIRSVFSDSPIGPEDEYYLYSNVRIIQMVFVNSFLILGMFQKVNDNISTTKGCCISRCFLYQS